MGEAKRKGRSEEVVRLVGLLVFDAVLQLSETGGDLISPCMYSYGDARESEAWSFGLDMDKGDVLDQAQERQHERVSMSLTSLAAAVAVAVAGKAKREAQGHQKRARDQRKSKQEKKDFFILTITHFSHKHRPNSQFRRCAP